MAALLQDSLALDGVSCVACHQQATAGDTHSGNLEFDDSLEFNADMFVHTYKAYGPYGLGKDEPPLWLLMMQYAFISHFTASTCRTAKSVQGATRS